MADEKNRVPGCGGLRTYDGPANSAKVFRHLVSEKIDAAFQDDEGKVWLVLASGRAFVLGSIGGGGPAYWVEQPDAVRRVVDARAEPSRAPTCSRGRRRRHAASCARPSGASARHDRPGTRRCGASLAAACSTSATRASASS